MDQLTLRSGQKKLLYVLAKTYAYPFICCIDAKYRLIVASSATLLKEQV